jgi:hypothetical protein
MRRYHCGGWLHITIMNNRESLTRIRMTHNEAHPHYVDTKEVEMVKLSQDTLMQMGQLHPDDEGDHENGMQTAEEHGPGSSGGDDYPWEHMSYEYGDAAAQSLYAEPTLPPPGGHDDEPFVMPFPFASFQVRSD